MLSTVSITVHSRKITSHIKGISG